MAWSAGSNLSRAEALNDADNPPGACNGPAAGEDRRPVDQAREVLLAAAGGKRSGAAAVRAMIRRIAALPLASG